MPMIADKLISLLYEWYLTFPRRSDEKTQVLTKPVFLSRAKSANNISNQIKKVS